jgi:hypothetical protein
MEARVASLEAHMANVRENVGLIRADGRQTAADINAMKIDLATLKAKVDTLPTKEWGAKAVIALAALVVAITTIGTGANIFFVSKTLQPPPISAPATKT